MIINEFIVYIKMINNEIIVSIINEIIVYISIELNSTVKREKTLLVKMQR